MSLKTRTTIIISHATERCGTVKKQCTKANIARTSGQRKNAAETRTTSSEKAILGASEEERVRLAELCDILRKKRITFHKTVWHRR